jgi:hypothetical protein
MLSQHWNLSEQSWFDLWSFDLSWTIISFNICPQLLWPKVWWILCDTFDWNEYFGLHSCLTLIKAAFTHCTGSLSSSIPSLAITATQALQKLQIPRLIWVYISAEIIQLQLLRFHLQSAHQSCHSVLKVKQWSIQTKSYPCRNRKLMMTRLQLGL